MLLIGLVYLINIVDRSGESTPSTTCCTSTVPPRRALITASCESTTRSWCIGDRSLSTKSRRRRCRRFTPTTPRNLYQKNFMTKTSSSSRNRQLFTPSKSKIRRRRLRRRLKSIIYLLLLDPRSRNFLGKS